MPWNQSENGGNENPWNRKNNQGPPDLDDILKKWVDGLGRIFNGGGSGGNGDKVPGGKAISVSISLIVTVLISVWLLSGIYIISEGKRGAVLRFGAFEEITRPGPHWHIPYPIEAVEKVDIDSIRSVQNKAQMLTQDENIVEVELAVQYRVKNAENYLFNVRQPDAASFENPSQGTIFQVMESALREIVGKSKMDFTLGTGRAEIASQTKNLMQNTLDDYRSGLEVINVNLQQSQPPAAVQNAFADAIKAREDEIRFINEAEAYSNGVLPKARGEAARMKEESIAYREKVIANSAGEASRFLQLYEEYRKAPDVTRERLYLQAMESVLKNTSKVMIDIKNSNNIFYLPLDQLFKNRTMHPMEDPERNTGIDNDSLANSKNKNNPRSATRDLRNDRN